MCVSLCFLSYVFYSPSVVAQALQNAFTTVAPQAPQAPLAPQVNQPWPRCGNLQAAHRASFAAMAANVNHPNAQNAQNAIQGSLSAYYAGLLQAFTTNLANSFIDTVNNPPVRYPSANTSHSYPSFLTIDYYFHHCHMLLSHVVNVSL